MSRESDLYKDKIEVSLDGRQIFYLFFGGAVIVGLVFVLGVMVGRRVEARGHVERAQTQAAVDPLAALDRLEGGAGLSFQGALRGGDAPTSDVEKTIGELAKQHEDPKKKPKAGAKVEPAADAKPAAKSEHAEPKAADAHGEAHADAKPAANADGHGDKPVIKPVIKPEHADAKPEHAEAKVAKADAKPEHADAKPEHADAKVAKADGKAEHADAKVAKADQAKLDLKPADAKSDAKSDKKPESKTKFTLQLSSFQDKGEAETYLSQMKSNGFGAYLTEADVDGKTYYRVRMGNYRSIDAANDAKAELEKATKKSATVMKL